MKNREEGRDKQFGYNALNFKINAIEPARMKLEA